MNSTKAPKSRLSINPRFRRFRLLHFEGDSSNVRQALQGNGGEAFSNVSFFDESGDDVLALENRLLEHERLRDPLADAADPVRRRAVHRQNRKQALLARVGAEMQIFEDRGVEPHRIRQVQRTHFEQQRAATSHVQKLHRRVETAHLLAITGLGNLCKKLESGFERAKMQSSGFYRNEAANISVSV